MRTKNWVEREAPQELVAQVARDNNCSLILAKLLVARKMSSALDITNFLNKSLQSLSEPYLFTGMKEAVERISHALVSHEHIGIFGDYDVDGVCSSAVLEQFLLSCGARVTTTLPHRLSEGYGLSKVGIDRLQAAGASLIITTDCGILAHEQIDYANSLGLEIIVVDHHNVGQTLPSAYAIVNPKRPDCTSQADYLCAAGVCFFLCIGLRRHLRELNYFITIPEPDIRDLLDLVALATVCDVVPLVKHNRVLVSAGLKAIQQAKRPGLAALIATCKIDSAKISSTNLGFHLGPRINASGRLEDATYALKLLREPNYEQALQLSAMLNDTNDERKLLETQTVDEACAIITSYKELPPALVLYNEHWHPGVVGIVASRIVDRFHRPTIIIGAKGKGSGRSIKGVDLHAVVSQASQSLAGFGGHAHAIGVTLGPLGVEQFRNDLLQIVSTQISPHVYEQELYYDSEILLGQTNLALVDMLAQLEPFGASNPSPILRINKCYMRNLRKLNGGHLKGELESISGFASFIGFRMELPDDLVACALDVLAVVEKNEWQGRVSVQLRLIDYKKSP